MAHNLSATIDSFRFVSYGEPAWHKLGTVLKERVSLKRAGEIADVYYNISLENAFSMINGQLVQIPDTVAIWREPISGDASWQCFGTASDHYEVVQNQMLFEAFDPLSQLWPCETVGALGKGDTIFFVLDAGIVDVMGEEIHQYFLVTDNKSTKQATQILFTPIRTVCANTLASGIASSKMNVSIRHYQGNAQKIIDIASTTTQMVSMMKTTNDMFKDMATIKFSVADFQTILTNILYPPPVMEGDNVTEEFLKMKINQESNVEMSVALFERFNDEFPKTAGTKWAAWNAVTELETHKPGRGIAQYRDQLFGKRANLMQTAFSAINGVK